MFIATTRAGVHGFLAEHPTGGAFWVGGSVLSGAEIEQIRLAGYSLTVLAYALRAPVNIDEATQTVCEHHPGESIVVEPLPFRLNPKSDDIGSAFLWREPILGVNFSHNDFVRVTSGPHIGSKGSLVTVTSLVPEPTFTLELESGHDVQIVQSAICLVAA